MYYLYILYSERVDRYYIGITNDYLRRLNEHNESDRLTYTSKFRPWRLEAVFETGQNYGEALKIERYIKQLKSRKLIEKMVLTGECPGNLAQLVRVPTRRD